MTLTTKRGRLGGMELPDDVVTISEAAKILGCSGTWIRKLMDLGQLPDYQVRHHRYTSRQAAEARAAAKQIGNVRRKEEATA